MTCLRASLSCQIFPSCASAPLIAPSVHRLQGVTSPLAGQIVFRSVLFGAFGQSKQYFAKDSAGSPRQLTYADFYKVQAWCEPCCKLHTAFHQQDPAAVSHLLARLTAAEAPCNAAALASWHETLHQSTCWPASHSYSVLIIPFPCRLEPSQVVWQPLPKAPLTFTSPRSRCRSSAPRATPTTNVRPARSAPSAWPCREPGATKHGTFL